MAAARKQWCRLYLLLCFLTSMSTLVSSQPRILGLYSMDMYSTNEKGGGLKLQAETDAKIRLVGTNLGYNNTEVFFTPSNASCARVTRSKSFFTRNIDPDPTTSTLEINLLSTLGKGDYLYMCVSVPGKNGSVQFHQGTKEWLRINVYDPVEERQYLLPLWLQITICVVLLMLSGLFSGLNLGLMSLDQTELRIIAKVGSESEKKYAERIGPLRQRGNFLLCTLLLGNVMVNSTFTILFDNLTNGLIAIISSTIGIVVFGEIIPQAICSRHGLAVGARTYWVTVFFMIITFPASFPISLILDKILGEEMGQVYNKEKLQELIRMTADRRVLHDNEANIISGALQLTNKSVEDVMTKIEDVYMLEISTVLDFETLTQIMHQGYTRIPVYDGEKTNIVNLLNTKDLALIDPDDKTVLSTVCKFYDHKPLFVDYDVKLDAMLQEFLHGNSHMAIVQKLHSTDDHDPYFENVGVITLEDVIEEILQSEIVDETDLKTDNRQKEIRKKQDYGVFVPEEQRSALPKQLAFVAFQFLTTNVEPFSDAFLARNVLRNLMKKDIVVNMSPLDSATSKKNFIYQKGVAADKFVLILQGTVEVEIGGENMVFETGPFSYFGVECLNCLRKQSTLDGTKVREYVPDFSVRAVTDVQYLCIRRAQYIAALRTTKMLRQSGSIVVSDAFEAEYEKITKANTNRNSVLESHSPPPNTPLEYLKYDDTGKKKSTSSLDRLTFFHRKHDPLEGLHRMRRTGSDAKEPAMDYGEMDSRKAGYDVRPSRSSGDSSAAVLSASPSADGKKRSLNSLTLSGHSHKLDFLQENEASANEEEGLKAESPVSPTSEEYQEVTAGVVDPDGDKPPAYHSGDVHEAVPLMEIKSPASKGVTNTTTQAATAGYMTNNKDAERVPLMNHDTSPDSGVL